MRRLILIALLLAASVAVCYWPLAHAGFINFDDPVYVTNNPDVFAGFTWHSLGWCWTTFRSGNWHPITWLSHMADCQFFGENAMGHHLISVGFHVANTLLLVFLWYRMTGAFWRSAFVAGVFAVHPVHVESVAWISERKDVLSAFFGLLSLLAYFRYAGGTRVNAASARPSFLIEIRNSKFENSARRSYYLSLICLMLGLMSKPMLVTWPFLMLLLDFWPLERLRDAENGAPVVSPIKKQKSKIKNLVIEKVPFFLLSLAASIVTFLAQKSGGAIVKLASVSISDRVINALAAYASYIEKTFWPEDLAIFYPFPREWPIGGALVGAVLLALLSFLAVVLRRKTPWLFTGWFWFCGMLIPVIGLVEVGSQSMADRYMYLPLVGLSVCTAWSAEALMKRFPVARPGLATALIFTLASLGVTTWVQAHYWKDSLALFSRSLDVTEPNPIAEHNLGYALATCGAQREAIKHFDQALALFPGYATAHFNRANSVGVLGRMDEAIAGYREAIRYQPDYEQAYYKLGCALVLQGQLDEAKTNFETALRYKPDYAEAETRLGNLLLLQGQTESALNHLGAAVRFRPDYDEGNYYLAELLARQKQFEKAADHLRAAIKANPRYASALNDLAWIEATELGMKRDDLSDAIKNATRACELTGYADAGYLDTLSVCFAQAGLFTDAAQITEKALAVAQNSGNQALAALLTKRLEAYREGKTFRGT